ncbi:hypothetical protein [Microbulbifer sp. VAAF005]|uniref:hypothetical protein n=1 Tax=Microbulbifer sp. VAAF005 TaxID=3034230 RepID=UPI0024ADFFAC|nr:hypothetical protein [Microbulbifer sp. VAAF005]WHI46748.1 hypothetical protein P0078_24125 [Microbulbifer sp. VAAF005]
MLDTFLVEIYVIVHWKNSKLLQKRPSANNVLYFYQNLKKRFSSNGAASLHSAKKTLGAWLAKLQPVNAPPSSTEL